MNTTINELKQPPILKLAFVTAMFERFGFYFLTFLIVLYLKSEYNFSDSAAFLMYGAFSALAYLATAAGGYLADNIFGIRRCVISGLICEAIGLTMLGIPEKNLLPISLGLIIIGVGLFKTGPTHLLGRSYKENDPRIDSGFTLYYMGMNVGSFTTSLLAGVVQKYCGWHIAFLYGGIGIAAGLVAYLVLRKSAAPLDSTPGLKPLSIKIWTKMIVGIILAIGLGSFLVNNPSLAKYCIIITAVILAFYFSYEITRSPKHEKMKITACLILIAMGLIFYILYQQAYTSMVLFINRSVDRHFLGIDIPTVAYFGLNPFWVIILGPILASLYNYLHRHKKDVPITVKFPLGLFVTCLCFVSLVVGAHLASAPDQVSSIWIVLAYLFYTAGEMLVSALGPAMITHIAPKRMYGVMMGTWFVVGMALSSILGSMCASIASVPDTLTDSTAILHIYSQAFTKFAAISFIITLICFAVGPAINRMTKAKALETQTIDA